MNKIEAAIQYIKQCIDQAKSSRLYFEEKMLMHEESLQMLEKIQRDNSIPNEENKVLNSKP